MPGQTVSESEKSFFDLVYLLLFRPTPYSRHTWGDFFRQPLSKALLDDIKRCSDLELKDRYFNPHTVKNLEPAARVMENMIRLLKRKLEEVEKHVVNQGTSIKEFRRHFKKDPGRSKKAIRSMARFSFRYTMPMHSMKNTMSSVKNHWKTIMVPWFTPKNGQAIITNLPARNIFGKASEAATQDRIRGVMREAAPAATLRAEVTAEAVAVAVVAEAVFEARQ